MRHSNLKFIVRHRLFALFLFLASIGVITLTADFEFFSTSKVSAENSSSAIENALYTNQEFFGEQAFVPRPTAEARENLASLFAAAPDDPRIAEKLAELDEKLERFDETEQILTRQSETDSAKFADLAAFYHRRGRYEKEAAVLKQILFSAAPEKRGEALENLVNAARIHDLNEYLTEDFFVSVIKENQNFYPIFEKIVNKFDEEKSYDSALKFLQQAKTQFPEKKDVLMDLEIKILLETNKPDEAEKVYMAAFDPLWPDAEAEAFYDFLDQHDHLRAYGAEMKARLKTDPADFDAAIRYALYRSHDYISGNDDVTPIIAKLESARKSWSNEELVTCSRVLLRSGNAQMASRFLYTLYQREDFRLDGEMRARILYQLFEMFSDAENEKLPLVKGDLRFYEDVARVDTEPGLATGILSLIFSDTDPGAQLEAQETAANKYFNRAAAYRVFEEYKKENPDSPELAQMYLDIVRLYAATGEPEIADRTLDEFAAIYENSNDYPAAALKLADAYTALKQADKARTVYQKILDRLGGSSIPPSSTRDNIVARDVPGEDKAAPLPAGNEGIKIPNDDIQPRQNNYYYADNQPHFHDYLDRKAAPVTYAEVMEKLVTSLALEKKTTEILAVYSNEIAKYPDAEWLYEQRLNWLSQTNLAEEKLQVYKAAVARFQSASWRDKLARFFLREDRRVEFQEFSETLVGQMKDVEIQHFLSEFTDNNGSASDFDKHLYVKLYTAAHERFPHNLIFVDGLLAFYKTNDQPGERRKLATRYYFASPEIRKQFLTGLARSNHLRDHIEQARASDSSVSELFLADASIYLSDYENAVEAYRKLNGLYPHDPSFEERLLSLERSFGQKNREELSKAADVAAAQANFEPSRADYRTRSGELRAELGDYDTARKEWDHLVETGANDKNVYANTATVFWDYFQYTDALRTISAARGKFADDTLYSFESGAIYESQNKLSEAVGEYVKALGSPDETQREKSQRRLVRLTENRSGTSARAEFENLAVASYNTESAKRRDPNLAFGFAQYLADIKQTDRAEIILNAAIGRNTNVDFLKASREFYQNAKNAHGEQVALARLSETAPSQREKITYELQLAESDEEINDRNAARKVLFGLVQKFPTNYGVLTEASDFLNRLGFANDAAQILQDALPKARGVYRSEIAAKLAARLLTLNRLNDAERMLTVVHAENAEDTGIFRELAKVCVRTGNAVLMRKTFSETIKALKESYADRRELDDRIAELRIDMIDAFTRLKDYGSAVEQHIEIINREPENEASTNSAIGYVRRYGGAQKLLDYYLKLSADAFKNYRWNVVLARIYAANNDLENSAKNYTAAIADQPEMPELYLALTDIELKRNNNDEALKNLDEVLNLTGDAPEYVKRKIEILKRAGRLGEAEKEKAKLPADGEKKLDASDFAEAAKIAATESEKARELYRAAFAKLLADPLSGEMKAADLAGYSDSIREEEPLDKILNQFWTLRDHLIEILDKDDSVNAGEARRRIETIDRAMVESIAKTAGNFGTDPEFIAIHQNLQNRIEQLSLATDRHQTLSLIQDFSRRARLGDLEETILTKKIDEAGAEADSQIYLRNLVSFYNERGAYQRSSDALEKYDSGDLALKAEAAQLTGNREKELTTLREIYRKPSEKPIVEPNENVARYLEIVYSENPDELRSLTEGPSAYQLQLINFLLAKGSADLAHRAISTSQFSAAWKAARNAETSLALREFSAMAECYFCDALQFESIGNLIYQTPDKKSFLLNDDWFRLTREYGEWIQEKHEKIPPEKFLPAMIENIPKSASEQAKLGEFYLDRNGFSAAAEHLRLALELDSGDLTNWALLGVAYNRTGNIAAAEECWRQALGDESVANGTNFFAVLRDHDLAKRAREKIAPLIVNFLRENNADRSSEFQNLIRSVAASFTNEREKSDYFAHILQLRPRDTSLAAMLVDENLIAQSEQAKFYDLLIARGDRIDFYDYDFKSVTERIWTRDEAEAVYAQENNYQVEEPEGDNFERRHKYLDLLIEQHENEKAAALIARIEKELNGRYVRPQWLRLAEIRVQIRTEKYDEVKAETFIGIRVPDSSAAIIPPNLERFNEVCKILREENGEMAALNLSENFFARQLALGQVDTANFAGLARALYKKTASEKALQILRLMVKANDETTQETALAELANLEEIKTQEGDATKISSDQTTGLSSAANSLKIAAETSAEIQQPEAAIEFRRKLGEINSTDLNNKIELAKLLIETNKNVEAAEFLSQIETDQNAPRTVRWQARNLLVESGQIQSFPNIAFDVFSQFYSGEAAIRKGEHENAVEFFINSLIADKDNETSNATRQDLMRCYALSGKPFASLKLAQMDSTEKPDDLLEILSLTAEKTGNFAQAIGFEKARKMPGAERVTNLEKLREQKNRPATDLKIDTENTRKL